MRDDLATCLCIALGAQVVIGSLVSPEAFILPLFGNRGQRSKVAYRVANGVAATFGIALLAAIGTSSGFDSITTIMLAIGGLFVVQLLPLVIAARAGAFAQGQRSSDLDFRERGLTLPAFDLKDIVHPALPVTAVSLLLAYLALGLTAWKISPAQLLAAIFFNAVLAAIIGWQLWRASMATGAQAVQKHKEARHSVPILIFISIFGIVYYVLKHCLISSGLHEIRPIMMSCFLQMLTVAVFAHLRHIYRTCTLDSHAE